MIKGEGGEEKEEKEAGQVKFYKKRYVEKYRKLYDIKGKQFARCYGSQWDWLWICCRRASASVCGGDWPVQVGLGMMVQCAGWVGHSLHADPPNRLLAVSSLTCHTMQYGTLPYNAL